MYIKPKKSLGQNFLIDKNIRNKIIATCNLSKEDIVLEIGAGKGELSAELANIVGKIYALELDSRLIEALRDKAKHYTNFEIIKGDILKFDINRFVQENKINQKIIVIGNIPYYISSPIIEHLIKYRNCVDKVFMTVQKEFAARVVSLPGSKNYSSFSCFVQYYTQAKILFEITRGCFKPVPKVDSSFLYLKFLDKPSVEVEDEEGLFRLIRTAFNQRRKTLRNSLKDFVTADSLNEFFRASGIDQNIRPEKLSLVQFAHMLKKVKINLDKPA